MHKFRLVVVALVMSLLGSFIGNTLAQAATVAATLASEDFSTVASLLEGVEIPGGTSVFLPPNSAFEALPETTLNYIIGNEEVLNAVLAAHLSTEMLNLAEGDVYMDVIVSAVLDGAYVVDSVIIPDIELPFADPLDYSDGSIVTAGSSTVFPLAERMGEIWADLGGVAPSIDSIGSGAGFERFCVAGESDISNASRAIKDSEVESCGTINRNPIEFRVGTDALAITISASNDFLTDVTTEELALIFSTATNWSDIRAEWPAQPICRFIPGTDSGTFDYFVEEIFDEDEAPILGASCLQLSEDDNVLVQGVQDSPYAIGFFGFAYYQENQDTLNILNVNGVEPNGISAEDGSYALARPLFMYSDAQILADKPEVAAFLNFMLTNVNDEIVDVGYFPASARALNLARLGLLATGIYDM
jgi:phosphate transport system substrate-binding protein